MLSLLNVFLHIFLLYDGFSGMTATTVTSSGELDYPDFEALVLALHKDVQFMNERLEQLNIDAIFGITLTEANIAFLLSPGTSRFLTREMVNNLTVISQMCFNSRNNVKKKLITNNRARFSGLIEISTEPQMWTHSITWTQKKLKPNVYLNPTISKAAANELIFFGTPQEFESDFCLMELTTLKYRHHDCQISDRCAEMLLKNDNSRGYPLTHRLLFIQTATALNCKQHPKTDFSRMIEDFCDDILGDLWILESWNFPFVSRDLAMEQILLCGLEGFSEFANGHYAKLLLNWPNSIGCFAAAGFKDDQYQRNKRSTNLMDHGCDNHASGVAAATLSLLLRALVENRASYLTPTGNL